MSLICRILCGFMLCFFGWISIVVATATNDWVVTCRYGLHTCKKMDELGVKGLWAECFISTSLYHCVTLNQILDLPAYLQTARALMTTASIIGLPSLLLLMTALPCVRLGEETQATKQKRAVLGGVLNLLISLCGIVSTVWFPIGVHYEDHLMTFGFSLYAGWVGSVMCLLGGSMMTCCSGGRHHSQQGKNHFYYSKHSGTANAILSAANHAKSAHV
ncbi:claudin-11-like isoform X1 [Denticeps clupeoides]|uniref:Claudin n=2 Tax=Denticeps clupeoides TaxID=299321 RepID=A0AAY4EZD5_9TELE|nr:claudin-11-like isoform X1 [Denticeps clupeoides]